MRTIGISDDATVVFEGDGNQGHGVWPAPVLSIATVIMRPEDEKDIPATTNLHAANKIFREDSFDPVTRIRRGRLYVSPGAQPQTWRVQPHPAYPRDLRVQVDHLGQIVKQLYGFQAWLAFMSLKKKERSALIALGTQEAFTLWRIVSIERIVTGEDLITLRARGSLGTLPDIALSVVPADAQGKVLELLEKLSEAAYRAGPESVIDRARDAAQWCIGVWLATEAQNPSLRFEDLGHLAKKIPEARAILRSTATSLARLHSRVKPNEQQRLALRVPSEEDAEFSLASVGLMLREIGWAI